MLKSPVIIHVCDRQEQVSEVIPLVKAPISVPKVRLSSWSRARLIFNDISYLLNAGGLSDGGQEWVGALS